MSDIRPCQRKQDMKQSCRRLSFTYTSWCFFKPLPEAFHPNFLLPSPPTIVNVLIIFFYLNLLTCETFTSCISETSYLLIKQGVSWRVFGVCFLFLFWFLATGQRGWFSGLLNYMQRESGNRFSFPPPRGPDAADQTAVCVIDHISWRPSTCGSFSQLQTSVSRLWVSPCGGCKPLLICQYLQGMTCL